MSPCRRQFGAVVKAAGLPRAYSDLSPQSSRARCREACPHLLINVIAANRHVAARSNVCVPDRLRVKLWCVAARATNECTSNRVHP